MSRECTGADRCSIAKQIVQNSRGFTLLEVLIALVVFAVGALAYAALLPVAVKNVDQSAGISQATAFAQQRLEMLKRNGGFGTLAGMVTTADPPDTTGLCVACTETTTGTNNTVFTVRTWVKIVPGTTAPRREATVTVITSWTDATWPRSLRLDTLIAE